jgi:hypothetical protein
MVLLFLTASMAVIIILAGISIAFVFRQQAKLNDNRVYPPGRWKGIWLGIGLILGVPMGMVLAIAFDNRALIGTGPAIGAGIGMVAGHIFEKCYGPGSIKLTPEEVKQGKVSLIIVSVFVLIGLLLVLLSVL